MQATGVALAAGLLLSFGLHSFPFVAPQLTFAEMRSTFAKQEWVLLKYEDGEEYWVSLRDGRRYLKEPSGRIQYFAPGIWQQYLPPSGPVDSPIAHWPSWGHITESRATPEEMRRIANWTPQSAWQFLMGEYEHIEKAKADRDHPYRVSKAVETVDGQELVRFDIIYTASERVTEGVVERDGQEIVAFIASSDGEGLYSQIWADPKTQLPVRGRKRTFSADGRGLTGGFVDGAYSFPESGPKEIYDLGVPRNAKIVRTYWGAGAAEYIDRPESDERDATP